MNLLPNSRLPFAVLGGALLYIYWSIELLMAPGRLGATPMYLWRLLPKSVAIAGMFLIGVSTLYGICRRDKSIGFVFVLPQMFALMAQATCCMSFASLGHYSDGTVMPSAHIRVDQMPFVIGVLANTLETMDIFGRGVITNAFMRLMNGVKV